MHRWHQIYCLKSSFTLMLQLHGQGKAAALLLSVFLWTLKSYLCPPADSQQPALYSPPLRRAGRLHSHLQIEQRRVDFILDHCGSYQPTIWSAEITMYQPKAVMPFFFREKSLKHSTYSMFYSAVLRDFC